MVSPIKRLQVINFFLLFTMFVGMHMPSPVHAEAKQVKVGYFLFEGFNDVYGDEQRSGYGYEYLQKVAEITGWNYVYVPGTWQEQLVMLENGEIDLLGGARYTEQRAQMFDYPDIESGISYVGIYVRRDRENMQYGDIAKLDGLKVGFMQGSDDNPVFEKFCNEKGLHTRNIIFGEMKEMKDALRQGKIDAFVSNNLRNAQDEKLIASFEPSMMYFITTKGNQQVLDGLNKAMRQIKIENPMYDKELFLKHYGKTDARMLIYTQEERDFIAELSLVKVGYVENYYPMEYFDDAYNTPKGIVIDLLNLVSKSSGIEFQYVRYQNYLDLLEGLKKGEVDIVGSIPDNMALAEKYKAYLTKPYMSVFEALLSVDDTETVMTDAKVVIPQDRIDLEYYLQRFHPKMKIMKAEDRNAALDILIRGEADFAIQNLYVAEEIMRTQGKIRNLGRSVLAESGLAICMAVSRDDGKMLVRVLNKGIDNISFAERDSIVLANTRVNQITVEGFFLQYYLQIIAGGAIVIIVGLCLVIIGKRRKVVLLEKLAQFDRLSDVYNRETIKNEVNQLVRTGMSFRRVLFIIDIDYFKQINDTYGHPFGDEIIRLVSKCLKKQFAQKGLVGRLGGDEFVVFLNSIELENDIVKEAERLNRNLRKMKNSKGYQVTCSIGIAKFPEGGYDFDSLYETADKALYHAKQNGRDRYSL